MAGPDGAPAQISFPRKSVLNGMSGAYWVGRCRSILSQSVLNVPMVSAISA